MTFSTLWFAFLPLLLFPLFGFLYQRRGLSRDRQRCPPPGRLLPVGDSRLHAHVQGTGGPVVVLEAGVAASSVSWALVQPAVARFTTVVSYDRAGLGWSEANGQPRTPRVLVAELRALLREAGLPGPYVLVGHSFGGLLMRCHAAWHPNEVAGVVMVDALHPEEWLAPSAGQQARLSRGVRLSRRGATLARLGVVRIALDLVMAGSTRLPKLVAKASSGKGASVTERLAGEVRKLPQSVWPAVRSHWCNPKCFLAMAEHLRTLPDSSVEAKAAGPLGDLPLVVVTAGGLADVQRQRQAELARLSSRGRLVTAERSGHWVQLDEPERVVDAVREVVEAVRHATIPSVS